MSDSGVVPMTQPITANPNIAPVVPLAPDSGPGHSEDTFEIGAGTKSRAETPAKYGGMTREINRRG